VFKLDGERAGGPRTHAAWVYIDDLAAHFAHAKGRGATIVDEIRTGRCRPARGSPVGSVGRNAVQLAAFAITAWAFSLVMSVVSTTVLRETLVAQSTRICLAILSASSAPVGYTKVAVIWPLRTA